MQGMKIEEMSEKWEQSWLDAIKRKATKVNSYANFKVCSGYLVCVKMCTLQNKVGEMFVNCFITRHIQEKNEE